LGIEAQSANNQMDALQCFADEYRASCDRFKRDAGAMVCFVFALNSFQGLKARWELNTGACEPDLARQRQ
jgi:hypothetical protein